MKLTFKSEYAFLALIDLAEHTSEGYIKISDIAKRKGIPVKFLESILLSLKKAGFCESKRGTYGGYMLAKNPGMITLAEIIRLMDGALAPVGSVSTFFYRYTPIEKNKKMKGILKEIRDYTAVKMESITLADLL